MSAWIRQQNIPALLPPPARLLFSVGFEPRGREQAPAHQVHSKTQPEVRPWDYWPRRGIAEPPGHSLGGARRCPWPESSNSREGGDEHRQQRPRGSGSSPCPAQQTVACPQEQATDETSNKPSALHPCQHEVAFTGRKNTSQEPPKQHNSQTPAAPPSTNPLKSVCAAEVSPSTASCSGQQSSFPPEEAHRINAHTDSWANTVLLAPHPSRPSRA